jgi:Carboxylesterase type B
MSRSFKEKRIFADQTEQMAEIAFTKDESFRGTAEHGIRIFRGITFARYGKFEEARMEVPDGQVDATEYGCVCPQHSSRLASVLGEDKGAVIEEGRLCLTVYSPEGAEKLPVMVWIHGGSFLTGGSEERRYSGERLVRTGNIVVVKISYRLGALGYLWMPGKGIANLGLKDQQLALEWIAANIGRFGGDPGNITLFGQSAGALSIAGLIATCKDRPLFQKAILQSAPLGITIDRKRASKVCSDFLKTLGKPLESATYEEILTAQEAVKGPKTSMNYMPMVEDFTHIPEAVKASRIKIVIGYTAHDASPFLDGVFGKFLGSPLGRLATSIVTTRVFSKPSELYIRKLQEAGIDVTRYFISWYPKSNPLGACHCMELPFILGEYDDWADSKMLKGMTIDEYAENSKSMLEAWTGFANKGVFEGNGILKTGFKK